MLIHAEDIINTHGSLSLFSNQGDYHIIVHIEKFNDVPIGSESFHYLCKILTKNTMNSGSRTNHVGSVASTDAMYDVIITLLRYKSSEYCIIITLMNSIQKDIYG